MKTMKKLCLCILALILVSVTVFGFTACGNNENEECVHEWGEWETVTEPTCVAAGKEKRVCALDVDGTHVEEREIPKLEHTFTSYVSNNDATCTSDGTKSSTCDVCGEVKKESDFGSMLPHTFDKKVATEAYLNTPADCDDKATYFYSCECGAKGTKVFEDGDYVHVYSEEFSFDETEHWHACVGALTDCACDKRSDVAEHEWDEGKVVTEPTCDTEGSLVYTCACGATKTEIIPVKHTLIHTAKKNATCEAAGNIEYWQCSDCGRYFTDAEAKTEVVAEAIVINKLAHDFAGGEWIYTQSGHYKKCADCEATDAANIKAHTLTPMSTSHQHWQGCECGYKENLQDHDVTLRMNSAKHWFECPCGFKSEEQDHEEARDAVPSSSKDNTCFEDGYEMHTCATCGLDFTKIIPAAHSNLNHFAASDATCTEHGSIEYWQCTVCNKYYKDSAATIEIQLKDLATAPLGHDFENGILKRDDTHHYTVCAREGCGVVDADSREAHIYAPAFNETHHYESCTVCGYQVNEAGHVWENPTVTKEPSCTEEGVRKYTCSCGATKEEAIPVKHEATLVEYKAPTCTEEGNIKYYHCDKCGKNFSDAEALNEISAEETVIEKTEHDFENGIYTYTNDKHAKICKNCDAVSEYRVHSFNINGCNDEMHWTECVCGCRTAPSAHGLVVEYVDENYHSVKCVCGYGVDSVSHELWSVAVDGGEHKHVCVCGYETATIPGSLSVEGYDDEIHLLACACGLYSNDVYHELYTVIIDETYHVHACACGYISEVIVGATTYTFDEDGHYAECDCGYDTLKESHNLKVGYTDDTQHWHECDCGYVSEVIDSSVTIGYNDEGHYAECEHGYTSELDDHVLTDASDAEKHYEKCECGYITNEVYHSFTPVYVSDTEHKHVCDDCGFVSEALSGGLSYEHDVDSHWIACGCGYALESEEHNVVAGFDDTKHYEKCVCGYTVSEAEHSLKAAEFNASHHIHECECGYKTAALDGKLTAKHDNTSHWQECSHGYTTEAVEHTLEKAYNDTKHFEKCECGYITNEVSHDLTPVYVSETEHQHTCVCGFVKTVDGKASVAYDANGHWSVCVCDEAGEIEEHEFTAVKSEDGLTHSLVCDCGYKEENLAHEYKAVEVSEAEHKHVCACGSEETVTGSLTFENDAENHWKSCEHGYVTDAAEHSYTDGKDADYHFEECECGHKINSVAHEYKAVRFPRPSISTFVNAVMKPALLQAR